MTIDELINIVLDALKGCVQGDSVGKRRGCDAETDEGKLLGGRRGSGFAVPRAERRGGRALCECSDTVDCLFERLASSGVMREREKKKDREETRRRGWEVQIEDGKTCPAN